MKTLVTKILCYIRNQVCLAKNFQSICMKIVKRLLQLVYTFYKLMYEIVKLV